MRVSFLADVPGGALGGWVVGEGEPVLVLHGGPGLSYDYVDELAADIGDGYCVGDVPAARARAVAARRAVRLRACGRRRGRRARRARLAAGVGVGHSWGGHLLLHVAVSAPGRLRGGLAVDPLGGVGDGGEADFEAELTRRTPPEAAARAVELDQRALRGEATEEEMDESLRLVWPAYFASPDHTLPYDSPAASQAAYSGLWDSLKAELPRLEAALPSVRVPFGVLAGGRSPMPRAAAAATAEAIPGAWFDVVEDAGHFPYFERPGCLRAGLDRLRMAGTT